MTPSMTRSLCPLAVFVAGFALLVATQVAIRQEARRRPDHGAALGVGALKLEPLSGRAVADSGPGQPAARHSPHAVNCSEWAVVPPVRAAFMQSRGPRYMISFSWWDDRGGLKRASGADKALGEMAVAPANEEVHHVQRLVLQSAAGAALVDVGANVGFMTIFAAATDRPVFAFDPIGYNVAKLCEGLMVNRAASTLSRVQGDLVHIFHAAVGSRHQGSINVTRPDPKAPPPVIKLLKPKAVAVLPPAETRRVTLIAKWRGQQIELAGLDESLTVADLKLVVEAETTVPPERQKLLGLKALDNGKVTDETPLRALVESGKLAESVFAFYLGSGGAKGELVRNAVKG